MLGLIVITHLFSILAGGLAKQAFKNHTHVFGVFKARKLGNSFQSEICFGEQLFDAAALNPPNFSLGRTFQVLAKFPFQKTARDADGIDHIGDGATMEGLFADEPHGGGHGPLFDGEGVR